MIKFEFKILGYSNGEILIKHLKDCFYLIELECRSCCRKAIAKSMRFVEVISNTVLDLTRGQETKLRIIVERNLYYNNRPYLLKTEKDEDELEDLLELTR